MEDSFKHFNTQFTEINTNLKLYMTFAQEYLAYDVAMEELFLKASFPTKDGKCAIKENRCAVVLREKLDPIAYCIFKNAKILSLYIDLDYRGLGIAKEIIGFIFKDKTNKNYLHKFESYDKYIES